MKELNFTIDAGELTAEVSGVPGEECLEITQGILDALGGEVEITPTDEMDAVVEADAYAHEDGGS